MIVGAAGVGGGVGAGTGTDDGAGSGADGGAGSGTDEGAGSGTDDGAGSGINDGARVGTDDGAGAGTDDGAGLGAMEGIGLGDGVGRPLGAGDGANVLTETDSTVAADIPPASRRRRRPLCSSRRRWPSSVANDTIAAVRVPSVTDSLRTLVTYSWMLKTPCFETMKSGTVTSFITLMALDVASEQTSSEKVALGITESSASRNTVALNSSH